MPEGALMARADEHREPATVYVITDAGEHDGQEQRPDPYKLLADLLRPAAGLAVVVVPILACTGLLFGLILGWSPVALGVCAFLALPVLVHLVDLAGAHFGWPPLAWTVARAAEERRAITSRENKKECD